MINTCCFREEEKQIIPTFSGVNVIFIMTTNKSVFYGGIEAHLRILYGISD